MSSTAPQLRSRLPRLAPRLAEAAVERARLTVVPRRRTSAPKVPFVTLVSLMLLAGVVGLLLFNTSMQQASFASTALEEQATSLQALEQGLQMQLERLRDPQRLAERAQGMNMVIPATAGSLHLATGVVDGEPRPAVGGDILPLSPPPPVLPAELAPPPALREPDQQVDRERRGAGDGRERGDRPRLGDQRDQRDQRVQRDQDRSEDQQR